MNEEEFIKLCAEKTVNALPQISNKLRNGAINKLIKDEKFRKKCLELLKEKGNQQATTDYQ